MASETSDPIAREQDATPAAAPPYNPAQHLITLDRGRGGRGAYMMTEDRVLWFRHDFPQGKITQELVKIDLDNGFALFRVHVETGEGGVAEGYGSETARDFGDYIEKASTKALGRALGALGYGTKGALAEGELADTPADLPHLGSRGGNARDFEAQQAGREQRIRDEAGRAAPPGGYQNSGTGRGTRGQGPPAPDQGGQLATERQVKFIYALAREAGLDEQDLVQWLDELYQLASPDQLSRRDAGSFIEALQRRRNEVQ